MVFLSEVFALIQDFCVAAFCFLFGKRRCHLEHSIFIEAPRRDVWQALWSSGRLHGPTPVDYQIAPVHGQNNFFRVAYTIDDVCQESAIRVIDRIEGEAYVARHIDLNKLEMTEAEPDETDFINSAGPQDDAGNEASGDFAHNFQTNHGEHYTSTVLREEEGGTRLIQYDDIEFRDFFDALTYPFGVRWVQRQFKGHIERRVAPRTAESKQAELGAMASTALLISGCWISFGFSWAMIVLCALMLQELGHMQALRLVGAERRKSFPIPFHTMARHNEIPYRSTLEEAFCALAGPLFLLVPLIGFFALYWALSLPVLGGAAFCFALVLVLAALPIAPLPGAQMMKLFLRGISQENLVVAGWIALSAGLGLALFMQSFALGSIICFGVYLLWCMAEEKPKLAQMSENAVTLTLCTIVAILAIMATIMTVLMSDPMVMAVFHLS